MEVSQPQDAPDKDGERISIVPNDQLEECKQETPPSEEPEQALGIASKDDLIASIEPLPDDSSARRNVMRLAVVHSCHGQVGAHAVQTYRPYHPGNHQSPRPEQEQSDVEQGMEDTIVATGATLVQAQLVLDDDDDDDNGNIVVKAENIDDKHQSSMNTCRGIQIFVAIVVVALLVTIIIILMGGDDDDDSYDHDYLENMDDEYKSHHYQQQYQHHHPPSD